MPFKEPTPGVKTMVTTSSESVEDRLDRISKLAEQGGGASKIEEQHKKGKKTARERLRMLLDPESFVEIDKLVVSRSEDHGSGSKYYSEGVVTGYGTVDGRTVFVFAHDFTVQGGSARRNGGKENQQGNGSCHESGGSIYWSE